MTRPLDTDVFVCGAGPTGLMLALRLARSGVRLRIVDAAPEPGTTSRAIVVQARTIEFYRQMGLADAFVEQGHEFTAMNLWVGGRHVARVALGTLGAGISAFPYFLVATQDRHERFLVEQLRRAGVEVERRTRLLDFTQSTAGVRARLQHADGAETDCDAAYLAGCDGAHSRVREVVGAGFPGGTYSHVFYVADVEASGRAVNGELHLSLDESELLGIFPFAGGATGRLIGTVRLGSKRPDEQLAWADVDPGIVGRMGLDVRRVNWFSTYAVHHRVAERFRYGRVFLLGDAAHLHSPAGAQGMNTGIGDAVNLAWKLADVLHGRATAALLDSYEPERIAFARRLVATTDRAFMLATSRGRLARFVRMRIVPRVLPLLFGFEGMRRFMFRTLSQTSIAYRASPVSAGRLGRVHGGDRLPWVAPDGAGTDQDNFSVLEGREWQVHVYGLPGTGLAEACRSLHFPLHAFPWRPAMGRAGLTRDAVYLVRPDGHVAWVGPGSDAAGLVRHVETLMPRRPA